MRVSGPDVAKLTRPARHQHGGQSGCPSGSQGAGAGDRVDGGVGAAAPQGAKGLVQ